MVRDSQAHESEDKKKKELVEIRNIVDNMVYGLEKLIRENPGKIGAGEVSEAQEVIKEAKDKLNSQEPAELERMRDRLTAVSQKIATQMYQQAASQPGGGAEPGPGPAGGPGEAPGQKGNGGAKGGDDVVDAEYSEIN